MKVLKLSFATIALFCIYSCGSDDLASLKDLPQESDEMNVKIPNQNSLCIVTINKDGKTNKSSFDLSNIKNPRPYFVDANFDGITDVLVGDDHYVGLLKWEGNGFVNEDTGEYFFDYPIFSKVEKARYSLSIHNEYASYEKEILDDEIDEKDRKEILYEVFSNDYDYNANAESLIKQKYTIAKLNYETFRYDAIVKCNDITDLPIEWQKVVSKMKTDYLIEEVYQKQIENKIKKKQEEDSIKALWNEADAVKAYPQVCDEVWVDMGIESDDGETLYWATSDLIMRKDKTFGLANYGEFGSEFGWGDVTGYAESKTDLDEYGGANPPHSIVGVQEYDIVAAHLNNPIRLPSKTEWMRLLENCKNKFITINREEVFEGDNELPSWAQGQWMAEVRIPQISGDALVALSIKIDGIVSSVIVTQGGRVKPIYEGIYDYEGSKVQMGSIAVLIDKINKKLITENGYELRKISNETESRKIYGLLLTSRINGNELFFPLPSPNVAVKSGDLAMEFQSSQEKEFWSGTIADEDINGAYSFYIKGSNPTEVALAYSKRYSKNCIRPVTTMPTTVSIGKTKRSSIE